MKEYDLYIPVGKKRNHEREIARLKRRLMKAFGGLTYFPYSNEGLWKFGGITFRDEIVILRVISKDDANALAYFKRLKHSLQLAWRQKQFLIMARPVEMI